MKTSLWVLLAVILGGATFYYVSSQQSAPESPPEALTSDAETYSPSDFVWKITNAPNFEETMPYHELALEVRGKHYKVQGDGQYMGCDVNENWSREANELSKVVCWYGGGGHELGIFFESGKYLVKQRWIQESGGPEVNAPPFGSWEVLFEIS